MATQSILLIRHAEKPGPLGSLGVNESGKEDFNQLRVRGWQRAGALTQFFSSSARHSALTRPNWLFAASPSDDYLILRSVSTLTPLSRLLNVPLSRQFTPGDEKAFAHHLNDLDGTILIAWEHKNIPALARHLVDDASAIPDPWPEQRFDLVWLFARKDKEPRRFIQLPQLLLDQDSSALA